MRKAVITALCSLTLAGLFSVPAFARELIVGGQIVGIQINTEGVLVAEVAKVETESGCFSPAGDAGICQGDLITKINGEDIANAGELISDVEKLEGKPAELTVKRNERTMKFTVQPVRSSENQWMLGMWLRDGVSGIGTVTFCDPSTGTFGALGHAVSNAGSGCPVSMKDGKISIAEIVSITKGAAGTPGELNGCADVGNQLGSVERNTANGIFGHMFNAKGNTIMDSGEMCTGPAMLICTVNGGTPAEYTAEINRVYDDGGARHAIMTVTDSKLLALTGGIVQGMSGSPIIQNGKLVGAVTHVFVNDPTRGYAISIQDMLKAAEIEDKSA